jgi:hypothetical protein
MARKEKRRIIGVDCHPDTFTAAIVVGTDAEDARSQKVSDGLAWSQLETWFSKHAEAVEVVALESSGNSFAVYDRLTALGLEVLVLDSEVVSRLGKELVDTDKTSGSSVRKKQRCRNHGRADMRALLTQSGQSVLTCHSPSNPLYSWAWKLSFRKSRNHAVIAAARKIVVSVWYVLNGKALPLERAEQRMSLQWKLEDLAKHAGGASYVHRMGFKSRREYVEQKLLFFGKELDWAT